MSVFTRSALEGSPLADLHTIAGEIGLDGYRRLRKADLVDKILELSGGGGDDGDADTGPDEEPAPRARRSRAGRGRAADRDPGDEEDGGGDENDADDASPEADGDGDDEPKARPSRRSRGGRGRRGGGGGGGGESSGRDEAGRDQDEDSDEDSGRSARARSGGRGGDRPQSDGGRAGGGRGDRDDQGEDRTAEGTVEVLGNGSGFLRVNPPDPSDDDIYISAAQVRRCELVSGDRITGPVRPPRRSERYPSLVRIDLINDKPADEVAEGTPFDALPATFPTERFVLDSDDATLKAVEWLTPIGRGSRVSITGRARAGKTETLQRLAGALATQDGIDLSLVLVGVRPEETRLAPEGVTPVAGLNFAASADAQGQAVDRALDAGRRLAARGGHAVVLIDTLDGLQPAAARKALAAARAIVDGGTLTVIATATEPVGGETTVIALDEALTSTGRLPALDLVASGTVRAELLVGAAGAEAISSARAGSQDW